MQPAVFTVSPAKPIDPAVLDAQLRAASSTYAAMGGIMCSGKGGLISYIAVINAADGEILQITPAQLNSGQNAVNNYAATL